MRARDLLHNALHTLATIEQIAATLGIQSVESQPEEFWETQKRAVNADKALAISAALKIQVMDLVEQKSGE